MKDSKLQQNRFIRPLRTLVFLLSGALFVLGVVLTLVLNSTALQKRLFGSFAAPILSEYNLSMDFEGVKYSFPTSFEVRPFTLKHEEHPIFLVGAIEVSDVFWSGKLGMSRLRINQLELVETVNGEKFASFLKEFEDSSSAAEALSPTIAIEIGELVLDSIRFHLDTITVSNRLVVDHISLGNSLEATGTKLYVEAMNRSLIATSSGIKYTPEGEYSLDYTLITDSIGTLLGQIEGQGDLLMFTGDFLTDESVSLRNAELEPYEALMERMHLGFNGTTDSAGISVRYSASHPLYSLKGELTELTAGFFDFNTTLLLKNDFYKASFLSDFKPIFDVFEPKSVQIDGKTDFSDAKWNMKLRDRASYLTLKSEGIKQPIRAQIHSKDINVGPVTSLSAQLSLLPNLDAFLAGDSYKVLAAVNSVSSNGIQVKGINANFEHLLDRDTLWLSSLDPNFDLEFAGQRMGELNWVKGQFNHLNLEVFDPLDTGQSLMATADAHFSDDGLGALLLKDVVLQRPEEVIFLRELSLTHMLTQKVRSLVLSSDVLDFSVNGDWEFDDFSAVANHVLQDIIVQDPTPWPKSQFKFDLHATNVSWIADLAHVDIHVSEDAHIFGKYNDQSELWSATLSIPTVDYNGFYGQEIELTASQSGKEHVSALNASSFTYENWNITEIDLKASGNDYQNKVSLKAIVQDSIPSVFDMDATLGSRAAELSSMNFTIGTSTFSLLDNANLKWRNDWLHVDSLVLSSVDGRGIVVGELFSTQEPKIGVFIQNLDPKVLNYVLRNPDAQISGKLNASVFLSSSLSTPNITGQLQFKEFGLNGYQYGKFTANARLRALNDLSFRGQLRQAGTSSFYFNGGLDLISNEIDLRASLDQFSINAFNPMLGGVLDELEGTLRGGLELYGPLDHYTLNGAFTLTDGHFTVPIVGSELQTAAPVELAMTEKSITIDSSVFYVPKDGTTAVVYGGLTHNRFDSVHFNLRLHGDSIRAVDMARNLDGYFYGTAVVMGDLLLEGPLEQLHLDLRVATKDGTNFKIPLDNPTAVEMPSYIRFTDAALIKSDTTEVEKLEYFTTDIAIQATPKAAVELVLDEVLGDVIKARGSGNMRLKLLEDESLELYGLYTLESGNYLFTLQNIINKPFKVIPGGTILWSGDLYEAEVDIDAKYSLSTDLQGLVTNANYNNENVDVDLIINLSGALMNPNISFTVDLPNAPASYLEELERHFLNEDAMNYQAFSLLLLGEFYQQDLAVQEGFDFGGSVGRNTSELLVSEFGSWLAAGIGSYVDLELDYTSGSNPYATLGTNQNNLNLGLGKDFLDGRLSVNSSLDIPIGQSGVSTLLLGDTEVVYSITKDGKIKLRAFNRSNRNDPLMQNSGPYTQGVGILYHKEFEKVIGD